MTHRVEISKVLIHLRVAEDGVAFTHSPQHALEGLHLHPLDEARHEPTARRGRIRFEGSFPNLDTLTSCFVVVNATFFCSSPQLGSESLHAGASRHRVRLHRGEFFILGTKSLMLIIKRSMFHSRQLTVTVPLHGSDLHKADVTFTRWNVMFSLTYSHCRCIAFLFKPSGLDESGAARKQLHRGRVIN